MKNITYAAVISCLAAMTGLLAPGLTRAQEPDIPTWVIGTWKGGLLSKKNGHITVVKLTVKSLKENDTALLYQERGCMLRGTYKLTQNAASEFVPTMSYGSGCNKSDRFTFHKGNAPNGLYMTWFDRIKNVTEDGVLLRQPEAAPKAVPAAKAVKKAP